MIKDKGNFSTGYFSPCYDRVPDKKQLQGLTDLQLRRRVGRAHGCGGSSGRLLAHILADREAETELKSELNFEVCLPSTHLLQLGPITKVLQNFQKSTTSQELRVQVSEPMGDIRACGNTFSHGILQSGMVVCVCYRLKIKPWFLDVLPKSLLLYPTLAMSLICSSDCGGLVQRF